MALNNSSSNNTPFTVNSDKAAQMTGSGNPGSVSPLPTYAAAVSLTQILFTGTFALIRGVSGTSATCAVTSGYISPIIGARASVRCDAAGGTVTYTFGSGFKPSATAAPTIGTQITVNFISDGTNWCEAGRSAATTV